MFSRSIGQQYLILYLVPIGLRVHISGAAVTTGIFSKSKSKSDRNPM